MATLTVERPPARTRGRRRPRTLHIVATAAAVVAVLPLIYLVVRANDIGWAAVLDTIVQPRTLELSLRSVGLAAAVAAATRGKLPLRLGRQPAPGPAGVGVGLELVLA